MSLTVEIGANKLEFLASNGLKREIKLEEKPEVKPEEKEKPEVAIQPFSTGSFHYNLNNDICEFLEGLVVNNKFCIGNYYHCFNVTVS